MKTKFVKETDRKGTYIIEGSFDGTFFNIKRFICQVQEQETEKEMEESRNQFFIEKSRQVRL